MRKRVKQLKLSTETLRVLADGNLNALHGGIIYSTPETDCCTQGASWVSCCEPTSTSNVFSDCC